MSKQMKEYSLRTTLLFGSEQDGTVECIAESDGRTEITSEISYRTISE
jgi:hypothetical protein